MHNFRAWYVYSARYKLYNMEDINTVFWKFNFWRHQEMVGLGQYFFVLEFSMLVFFALFFVSIFL